MKNTENTEKTEKTENPEVKTAPEKRVAKPRRRKSAPKKTKQSSAAAENHAVTKNLAVETTATPTPEKKTVTKPGKKAKKVTPPAETVENGVKNEVDSTEKTLPEKAETPPKRESGKRSPRKAKAKNVAKNQKVEADAEEKAPEKKKTLVAVIKEAAAQLGKRLAKAATESVTIQQPPTQAQPTAKKEPKKANKSSAEPKKNVIELDPAASVSLRPSGKREIILNCEKMERRVAFLRNGRLEEFHMERDEDVPAVGSIYLGRIVNLDTSLQAAFVDIGAEKNAFLHYHELLPGYNDLVTKYKEEITAEEERIEAKRQKRGELKNGSRASVAATMRHRKLTAEDIPVIFKPGMEILVQVVKSPINTKGARVTTDISIAGRYLVLMPYEDHIGLSSRIEEIAERDRLREIMREMEIPEGMGVICRTAGEGQKAEFFKNDLNLLLGYWRKIERDMEEIKAPSLLFAEPNLIERTVRDTLTEEISSIIVDDQSTFEYIRGKLTDFVGKKAAVKVRMYSGNQPIFDNYKITEDLKRMFSREVKLPGGGAIVIDETEALIAIDVNTGHGRKLAEQPEFILKTNLEAAAEIARQLRLRDVGGLVVIDFIDMKASRDRDEVFRTMRELVRSDYAKSKILPISRLGIMEMTRQRERESIRAQVYEPCPYCGGSGVVKSAVTMSAEIQRALSTVMRDRKYRGVAVRVYMHPDVLTRLRNEDEALLNELESKYGHELSFRADPDLHCEEFRLVDPETGAQLKY